MSVVLECIGCRTMQEFSEITEYPVCPNCKRWEDEKFRREHEETYCIVRSEWGVKHDGHLEHYKGPIKYSTWKRPICKTPSQLKNDVWNITGGKCFYCNCDLVPFGHDKKSFTIDHVVSLRKGGKHEFENMVPACYSCNCSKGTK